MNSKEQGVFKTSNGLEIMPCFTVIYHRGKYTALYCGTIHGFSGNFRGYY
jgi:hypothetical protein